MPGNAALLAAWAKESVVRCVATHADWTRATVAIRAKIDELEQELERVREAEKDRVAPFWEPARLRAESARERLAERRFRSPDSNRPREVEDFIRRMTAGVNFDAPVEFLALVETREGFENLAVLKIRGRSYWSGIGQQGYAAPEYYCVAVNRPELAKAHGMELLNAAKRLLIQTGEHADTRYCDRIYKRWTANVQAAVVRELHKLARPLKP
jgi:hypothetical protein